MQCFPTVIFSWAVARKHKRKMTHTLFLSKEGRECQYWYCSNITEHEWGQIVEDTNQEIPNIVSHQPKLCSPWILRSFSCYPCLKSLKGSLTPRINAKGLHMAQEVICAPGSALCFLSLLDPLFTKAEVSSLRTPHTPSGFRSWTFA